MTTETNSVLNTVKEAFAPVTEAFTKLRSAEIGSIAWPFRRKPSPWTGSSSTARSPS